MVAPKLRSFGTGPAATASDPGTFGRCPDSAGDVRARQGTFRTLAHATVTTLDAHPLDPRTTLLMRTPCWGRWLVVVERPRHDRYMTTRSSLGQRRFGLPLLALVAAVAVVVSVVVVRFFSSNSSPGVGWVRAGSVEDIRAREVVFLPALPAYVVAGPPRSPITLLARSTHLGERIIYCKSSQWFEDAAHGTKFDRLGNYGVGPAPRGLDRLATIVRGGVVWVNPSEVTLGPSRGSHAAEPAGPFCTAGD